MADIVEIVVSVDDKASAVLGNIGNAFGTVGITIGNVARDLADIALGAVAAGFAAIGAGLAYAFVEASDAEQALTGLNTVLASTHNNVGLTSDNLQEMATNLQSVTRFSDEEIMSAESMLLRFENLNGIFSDALQLTTDYAASLGIDLTSAAQTIGKALDDPASGIGRLNTQFKLFNETEMETIKNMAANGDIAGAQAIIMDTLREKVGGAAEAFGNTFAGQVDIAKNHISDFAEVIGGPFVSVFTDMVAKFNDFAITSPAIKNITDFFTYLKDLIDQDVPPLAALGATFAQFSQLSPVFNEIGQGLLMMQGYITGGDNPIDALKKSIDNLLWAHPGGGLTEILTGIRNFIETGQTEGWGVAIGNVFSDIGKSLDLSGKLQGIINNLSNAIASADWSAATQTLATILYNAFDTAFRILGTTISFIVDDIDWSPLGESLKNAIPEVISGAFGYIDWESLKTDFWEGVSQVISLQFGGLSLDRAMWRQVGRDLVDGIKTGFSDGIGGLFENAQQFWTDYILYVKHILGISSPSTIFRQIGVDIVQGLIGGFTATWSNLLTIANNALGDFLDLFGIDLGSLLGSGASGLGTAGGGTGTTGGGTGGGTSGQVVNNYFYGTVYIGSSLDDANYDCPSPNPLVAASGNQLVATGF